jgi:hypothetical protein
MMILNKKIIFMSVVALSLFNLCVFSMNYEKMSEGELTKIVVSRLANKLNKKDLIKFLNETEEKNKETEDEEDCTSLTQEILLNQFISKQELVKLLKSGENLESANKGLEDLFSIAKRENWFCYEDGKEQEISAFHSLCKRDGKFFNFMNKDDFRFFIYMIKHKLDCSNKDTLEIINLARETTITRKKELNAVYQNDKDFFNNINENDFRFFINIIIQEFYSHFEDKPTGTYLDRINPRLRVDQIKKGVICRREVKKNHSKNVAFFQLYVAIDNNDLPWVKDLVEKDGAEVNGECIGIARDKIKNSGMAEYLEQEMEKQQEKRKIEIDQ